MLNSGPVRRRSIWLLQDGKGIIILLEKKGGGKKKETYQLKNFAMKLP